MVDVTSPFTGNPDNIGHIGRIPVRNLWLLMLYASSLFRHIDNARLSVEDNPDDIPDLVAEILSREVERRLKRNLTFGYQARKAILGRVRGRINFIQTERFRLFDRGMVACCFDELTVDTPRNRFVRAALEKISRLVHRKELARHCINLAGSLKNIGVIEGKPSRSEVSVNRFGRHDANDSLMVTAANLAFNLALPTEAMGSKYLHLPDREIHWIRKLYEKGIAGFYKVVLAAKGWRVDAGKTIGWLIGSKTPGIDKILPTMRTDIMIDHLGQNRRIIVDTKFNSIVTRGWYKDESLRSGYIYQIYTYLRSQEGNGDPLSRNASGLLLHPSVGDMVNESIEIQGHEIRFATVDLAATSKKIREQLLHVLNVNGDSNTLQKLECIQNKK